MNNCASSSAFTKLKPLCINLLTDCSVENINKLEEEVKVLDPLTIQLLQEFIIVPFRAHLTGKLSEKVTIKCIEFLTLVFKKSYVKQWHFFAGHFALIMSKLSDPEDISKSVCTRSEELKITICENILWLVRCSSEEVLNEMYSLSFRPHLAYAFFVFNVLLRQERSKTLLEAVLSTIGVLTYKEKYVEKKFRVTEQIASEALASCLPGLSITLQKAICNDKQGHNVITMALSILTDLIILTVGDESFERGIVKDSSCDIYHIAYKCGKESNCSEEMSDSIPVVIKDEAWFKSVSEKLEVLIENITILSSHNHWKVRLEYLKCTKSLLFKCTKSLKNCIPVLLPSVFGLAMDNIESVCSFAKCLLASLSENMNCTSFKSVIDDNIQELIANLIKYKFSSNDDKKLSTLKNLLGYIEISGLSFNKSFSMIHLERLVLTLITLLEFDVSEFNLVQEIPYTVVENFDVINPLFPKKKFKFFKNEEILSTICKLCYCLGRVGNSRLLIDYLLEKLTVNNLYTLQCIFIIGSIMKGLSKELDASHKYSTLINDVLEVFLSNAFMDVPTHKKDEINLEEEASGLAIEADIPDNVYNKNKIQVCLLLEAVAQCSECLGIDFKVQLIKVLCPVMEKAGSSNFVISQCGKLCLHYIARSCEYKSIQELIKDNADYITNILLINFHQYLYKPEMVIVLRVAIDQSDREALVLFRDLIFKILNILDYNQNKAYPLMVVLNSVVVYINKWFPCIKSCHGNHSLQSNASYKSLRTLVSDYMNLKIAEIKLEDFDEINEHKMPDTVCKDEYTEENKPNIPLHVNIICEIFKRCTLLQSSVNQYLRMLTLETVELCILVLRDYENQLLPLVHEFWSPFLRRFTENTFILKAFNVLLTIANECGDFIRQRSLKDIMPKIVLYLQKEYNKSLLKCNFKDYQWTNDHSLQVLVLSEIGNFCTKIDIDDKEINMVANACLPYLEKKQPKILQDAAVKSLEALATINPDSIYFYWNVLYGKEKSIIPPSNNLLSLFSPFGNNSLTL